MARVRLTALALATLAASSPALAGAPSRPSASAPARPTATITSGATTARQDLDSQPLAAGESLSGTLSLDPHDLRTFTVRVPADCLSLRIELSSTETELELWGMPPGFDDSYEEDWSGEEDPYIAPKNDMSPWVIVVDRYSQPPLETGEYGFEVNYPAGAERLAQQANFTIHCRQFLRADAASLAPNLVLAGALAQDSGCYQGYKIEVPKGTNSLRLDLFDSQDDLVLLARRNRPPNRLQSSIAEVNNSRGRKTLRLDASTRPKLRPGTWYIDVVDPQNADRTARYKLHASFEDQPPAVLLRFPTLPTSHGPGPLGASLAAVVELSSDLGGGSGTIIDAAGRILTNAHVVSRPDGSATPDRIGVALTLDPHLPPVELFYARVVEFDLDRDLALLELVEGYYHQSLPLDLILPFAPLAPAGSAHITDPLWITGYPWTGGLGQRVSLSVTAGVLTGYDRIEAGPVIKCDAEIASGNSGGAAFDAQGRLVGVPTATIGSDGDKIGYLHPVDLLPADWLQG